MKSDSEDVASKSLLNYYSERPNDLQDITLADFAAWYTKKPKTKQSRPTPSKAKTTDGLPPEMPESDSHDDEPPPTDEDPPSAEYTKRKVTHF